MRIPFASVIARPADPPSPQRQQTVTTALRRQKVAQLVALEYIRNGCDLPKAYSAVTHKKWRSGFSANPVKAFGAQGYIEFMSTLTEGARAANVDRDQFLSMIWANAWVSALDFLNDDGTPMTIAQLKALPPPVRALIEEVKVSTVEAIAEDKDGKPIVNDMGEPYKIQKTFAQVKLSDKTEAKRLLAQMMRWIGPTVVNNTNVINFAQLVMEANNRNDRVKQIFEMVGDAG